ncbi:hypothetical protein KUW15_03930 [Qipengyuania aquimaris]|uniref:hypothetical protein n=1 Tax=Qipengyuania aquimaris TaxID=255984 RepID=UPI001C94B480|nr:hypothetical protein [Qipengyuania aquimaris]MBY6127859.1 hypothetical protein [Qipengyuania aquimaris]
MSAIADAFDDMLRKQTKDAAGELDAETMTALAVHRQLVAEGLIADSANTLLNVHGAIREGMASAEAAYAKAGQGHMTADTRKAALGKLASWIADETRGRRKKEAKDAAFKASLPEGAVHG